jgi:hypothetical protein
MNKVNEKLPTPLESLEGPVEKSVRNELLIRNETPSTHEAEPSSFERPENQFMYVVLAAVTVFILLGLGWYAGTVSSTYGEAINALKAPDATLSTWDRFLLILTFARERDFGLVKGGALLLSFVVVTLGMLIVVRGTQVTYRLKLSHGNAKSALETSSPGLVLVTLGLGLALGVVMTQSTVELRPSAPNGTGTQTAGATQGHEEEIHARPAHLEEPAHRRGGEHGQRVVGNHQQHRHAPQAIQRGKMRGQAQGL